MTHPEQQYLDCLRRVLEEGYHRASPHDPLPGQPPNPGTTTLINLNMAFDLSAGEFPLITTRSLKASWRGIVEELLWFLSGSTNVSDLQARGVNFWNQWATPETAGKYGYKDGEIGPMYGYQWRCYNGRIVGPGGVITHRVGVDQIQVLLDEIVAKPHSKRMMVTTWNPEDANRVFIAPCHGIFRTSVDTERGLLHLHMFQRSGDLPVGIPFNIASYSLLLMMLAQVTGYRPGTFYHTISDAHIYDNQIPCVEELLRRDPRPMPRVTIDPSVGNLFDFAYDHFDLSNYDPHPAMVVPVAT